MRIEPAQQQRLTSSLIETLRFPAALFLFVVMTSAAANHAHAQGFAPAGPLPPGAVPPSAEFDLGPLDPGSEMQGPPIVDVRVKGNQRISTNQILARLRTRPDRGFDPDLLQADTQELMLMKEFRNVRPYVTETAEGVVVTFEVTEKPRIEKVDFIGNRGITTKVLTRESGLNAGDPLDLYQLRVAKERLEAFYQSKGFTHTQIDILEGTEPDDTEVIFLISEDVVARITDVEFVGNEFISGARLETKIKSKPGYFSPIYRNRYVPELLAADRDTLTAFYRDFGFFRAVVDTEIIFNDDHSRVTIRFVVFEGPRYKIRNIAIAGNEIYRTEDLLTMVELRQGENYDGGQLNRDVAGLKDLYGGNGYIQATVDGQILFLEEPGWVDLVFQITEGEQYRVGRINVNISGEYGVTRQSVVLARLDLRPGDIIDIRKIRDSERRLGASGLFVADPAMGQMPAIEIRPSDPDFADHAVTAFRGQSPDFVEADLEVFVIPPDEPNGPFHWLRRRE